MTQRHVEEASYEVGDPAQLHYYFNGMRIGDVSNNGTSDVDYATGIARHRTVLASGSSWGAFDYGMVGNPAVLKSNVATGTKYADFDQSYDAVNGLTYESTFSRYTVVEGDTLESIAQQVWGDSSYWYLIADANGLDGSDPLIAGTDLIIPAKVHNS